MESSDGTKPVGVCRAAKGIQIPRVYGLSKGYRSLESTGCQRDTDPSSLRAVKGIQVLQVCGAVKGRVRARESHPKGWMGNGVEGSLYARLKESRRLRRGRLVLGTAADACLLACAHGVCMHVCVRVCTLKMHSFLRYTRGRSASMMPSRKPDSQPTNKSTSRIHGNICTEVWIRSSPFKSDE